MFIDVSQAVGIISLSPVRVLEKKEKIFLKMMKHYYECAVEGAFGFA